MALALALLALALPGPLQLLLRLGGGELGGGDTSLTAPAGWAAATVVSFLRLPKAALNEKLLALLPLLAAGAADAAAAAAAALSASKKPHAMPRELALLPAADGSRAGELPHARLPFFVLPAPPAAALTPSPSSSTECPGAACVKQKERYCCTILESCQAAALTSPYNGKRRAVICLLTAIALARACYRHTPEVRA